MYIWIEDRVFISDKNILCVEKERDGYYVRILPDGGYHVEEDEGKRIIGLLQQDSIGQSLKVGNNRTINPQDIASATLYGENEKFQMIVLKTKRNSTIEVGTAHDLTGFEIVHNYFLTDRPPFSAAEWTNNKIRELEDIIGEFWMALYIENCHSERHNTLIKYGQYTRLP